MPHLATIFDVGGQKIFLPLLITSFLVVFSAACSTISTADTDRDSSLSYIELQVRPTTAEIYIDDEFHGLVEGWRHQTVPIQPGYRRLELRAPQYITQRFDLDVEPGELLTLTVRLETALLDPDQDETSQSRPNENSPALPPHPAQRAPDPL